MKLRVIFTIISIISGIIVQGNGLFQGFDKGAFYTVLASGDRGKIDAELSILREETIKGKEAYEGALLMKKARYAAGPKEKLRLFKAGYIKLESSLAKDSSNGEYHFLRLTIQEHAPRIVRYYKDQEKDCQYIYRSFGSLPPAVQKAILDYSKHSNILHAKYLNG